MPTVMLANSLRHSFCNTFATSFPVLGTDVLLPRPFHTSERMLAARCKSQTKKRLKRATVMMNSFKG